MMPRRANDSSPWRRRCSAFALLLCLIGSSSLFAQAPITVAVVPHLSSAQFALNHSEVAEAIRYGTTHPKEQYGLILRDTAQTIGAGISGGPAASGFTVTVYTPRTWIEFAAAQAAREFRPYVLDDALPYIREPVIRVFVSPSIPLGSSQYVYGSASVQHVVLRDITKQIVSQPQSKKFDAPGQGEGPDLRYAGAAVTFSLEDLRKVRGPNGSGEFFITVVSDVPALSKDFQVKSKHFGRLK